MNSFKIGVFDSGLGGLTVLKALSQTFNEATYYYLGDTARTPYGSKEKDTIVQYGLECANFLKQFNPDLMVVACNTVSAHALDDILESVKIPVIGMIEPAVNIAIEHSHTNNIVVIGTQATCSSQVYSNLIKKINPSKHVIEIACPLFVPIVEQGIFDGTIAEASIELYLSSVKNTDFDTMILGCTHYLFLQSIIQDYLGSSVKLINCATATVEELLQRGLVKDSLDKSKSPKIEFFITDKLSNFNSIGTVLFSDLSNKVNLAKL